MKRTDPKLVAALVLAAIVVLTTLPMPVAAAGQVDVETTYRGVDGDSQRIDVTLTISADDVTENLTIDVGRTQHSFVLFNSFKVKTPGQKDIDWTKLRPGVYRFSTLRPNQQINLTFDVYPRTIKQKSLPVATYTVSSDQNPNGRQKTVTATLSSSSWFQLQQAKDRIASLEQDKQSLKQQANRGQLFLVGGIALFVLGFAAAGGIYYVKDQDVESVQREAVFELESLETEVDEGSFAHQEIQETKQRLATQWGVGSEASGSDFGSDGDEDSGSGAGGFDGP